LHLDAELRHNEQALVAPSATKVLQFTILLVSVDLSLKMKYLSVFIYFLIQSVFGEEDPGFEETNDIPESKII